MKTLKKRAALFLAAALLLCLCACGGETGPYRVLETVGEKQYGLVYRQGDKLAAQVSAAMSALAADGTLSQLSTKWLGSDRACLAGDAAALEALGTVEKRTLIVGVQSDCRPMSCDDGSGNYTGMSVDIADAVGERLGWDVKIQPIGAGELAAQLSSGNIDCAVGFGIESLDPAKFTAGSCYLKSAVSVVVPSSSDIRSLRGLKGGRIGAVKDPSIVALTEKDAKVVKYAVPVTAYLTPARCLSAMANGWCSAVAMDDIMLAEYFK